MVRNHSTKLSRKAIGALLIALTVFYLFASSAAAQESPIYSGSTSIRYTTDALSWGDVYAFDQDAYDNSTYSKLNTPQTTVTYYTKKDANNTSTATCNLPAYVGHIKYNDHQAPTDQDALAAKDFSLFRNNVAAETQAAPIGSGETIPVVTTTPGTETGTYTVVPGSVGTYRVYVYSDEGTPSNVKYSIIKDYTTCNAYTGSDGLTALSFQPIPDTKWYVSDDIDLSAEALGGGLGWTAYETSFSKTSQDSSKNDEGTGTYTGKVLNHTTLGGSDSYYYNKWGATEVKFDTLLVIQFPSTVSLGPITKSGDTIQVTNNPSYGSVTVKDPFNRDVSCVNASKACDHMPLYIIPEAASDGYILTGVNADKIPVGDMYRYAHETTAEIETEWQHVVALPKITVTGGSNTILDGYFNPTGASTYTLSNRTAYTFTADFSEAVDGATVSYTSVNNGKTTSGTLTTSAPSFTETAQWGEVTVTFTITGDGETKTCTYTITDSSDGLPIVARVGTTTGLNEYAFLEEAIYASNNGASGNIYLLDNYAMQAGEVPSRWTADNAGYTIKSGVTLLVPYDSSNTLATTSCSTNTTYTTPTEFRRLTIPSGVSLTVSGSISIMSQIHAGGGTNTTGGAPTGPYGRLQLDSGSSITVNNGGAIYAYGFVTGFGTITAQSGAAIHETMQMCEFGGGSRLNCMRNNSYDVFPFSQYYIQNIECPLVINKGATETLHAALYAAGSTYAVNDVPFIGTSSGLFLLTGTNTTVTRYYHPGEDRMEYVLDGDASINKITISLAGYSFSSSDYTLPITGNMFIHVKSGTTTIGNATEIIPGAKIVIDEGATVAVSSKLFVYDSNEWLKATNGAGACTETSRGCHIAPSGSGYGFVYSNKDLVAASYSPTRSFNRTAENMPDAEIDVNGTMNVTGYLNTTTSGAEIISSEGTGIIKLSNNSAMNLYQATNAGGSSFSGYVGIFKVGTTNAQFKNGSAYTGTKKEYIQTDKGGTGTYKYDAGTEQWYKYKVTYQFNGATVFTDYIINGESSYAASGITNLGAVSTNGTATVSGDTVNVTGVTADCTVSISGTAGQYIPYFVLNEKQYTTFHNFTGNSISDTVTIDGSIYYVIQQATEALSFGASLAAPSDAAMGVSAGVNSITWRLADNSVGDIFTGTVPQGDTENGPVYIYGFYSGYVTSVTLNGSTTKYATLEKAFAALEINKTYTITMLADCGTFEDEDPTATLSTPAGSTVTFDLAGHTAVGAIINNGTMTLELNGGTFKRDSAAVQTSASAAVMNIGTMTIQDSTGGGTISNNSWRTVHGISASAEVYQAVVRNAGENAKMTIGPNLTLSQPQTAYGTNAEDAFTSVGIVNVNGATLVDTQADISVPTGAAIYNFGGTIKSISGGTITAKQGVYNRNMRTAAAATSPGGYQIPFTATIESIGGNVEITVSRYAVHNRAIIKSIGGNAKLTAADYVLNCRGDQWYFDNQLKTQTNSTSSPYTRVNTYDTVNIATIERIEGSAQIKATTSYAVYITSGGILNEISGGAITAPKQAVRVIGTRYEKITYTYFDKNGGVLKTQDTYYTGSRLKRISGGTITTTGGAYAIENYAYIDEIAGGTFTSSSGSTVANINSDGNQYSRIQYTRTANDTTYDINQTYDYFQATIGTIGSATIKAGNSGGSNQAILNRGLITSIKGSTLTGNQYVLSNSDGVHYTCSKTRTTIKRYVSGSTAGEKDLSRTYYIPTIGSIDGMTVNYTSYGIRNYGKIGEITNSTIVSTTGERAIDNESYTRTNLDYTYTWDGYTPTVATTTTQWAPCEIDLIGSGNEMKATKYVVINLGRINTIDGGDTTSITATNGVAVYNYRGLKIAENGTGYVNPTIGTIKHVTVSATGYGIQNGEGNDTYGVATINEIGEGAEVKSTGNDAVRNASKASLGSITGGIYTSTASGKYGFYNNGTGAVSISGGDFKGNGSTSGRNYAIYLPDDAALQTYPTGKALVGPRGVTFHDGTSGTGYYFPGTVYTITWMNGDVQIAQDTVGEGSTPSYSGTTPTKAQTDQYTYTFDGWSLTEGGEKLATIPSATADATYYAHYSQKIRTYTITWKQNDGTTIDTTTVEYGKTPTHSNPTKASDAQYSYTFAGWTPALTAVTGDATYTATFTPTLRQYTVTFMANGGGGSMGTQSIPYGVATKLNANTFTAPSGYGFSGWNEAADGSGASYADGADITITGDKTLYAQWAAMYSYTVTWGDLSSFTYTAPSYEWNAESMSYVQTNASTAGWSSSASPYVTVTNNSTTLPVHGALTFVKDASITAWVPGMSYFSNAAMTTTANSAADIAANGVWTVYMMPTGTPETSWSGTKTIGTVRITVSSVD